MYFNGQNTARDVNKAIHYFSLASSENDEKAQYLLGKIYYEGFIVPKNINKSLYYLNLANKNDFQDAQLLLGDIYLEGKYVKRNIKKAISFYKMVSSFYNNYAKNNLGIIYKRGFNEVEPNIYNSQIYFTEAIKEKDDLLSKYNLANILIDINKGYDESIKLLISSAEFEPSAILLSLVLIRKYGNVDLSMLKKEFKKYNKENEELISHIYNHLENFRSSIYLCRNFMTDALYMKAINTDFVYINDRITTIHELDEQINTIPKLSDINEMFYEGFGINLYQ